MTTNNETLTEQALALPADARLALVERLLGSLDPLTDHDDIRAAWIEEANRRRGDVLTGKVETISVDQALAGVRSHLRES